LLGCGFAGTADALAGSGVAGPPSALGIAFLPHPDYIKVVAQQFRAIHIHAISLLGVIGVS
jgi:hypothetical protein